MENRALPRRHVPRGPFFWPRLILLLILLTITAAWAPLVAEADWPAHGTQVSENGPNPLPGTE